MKPRHPEDEHRLIRNVPYSKLRKKILPNGDEEIVGVLHTAFALDEGHKGLSAAWPEYFEGEEDSQLLNAVRGIRTSRKCGGKSAFALGVVGEIRQCCAAKNHSVRIVHAWEEANHSHAEVRRYPADQVDLYELLATTAWAAFFMNRDIPD